MITFSTSTPQQLLDDIKTGIDAGHIATWSYDNDGDFTHTPAQWAYRAWLRPVIQNGSLAFVILGRNDANLSVENYAIYHGRFLEMMLAHFDKKFSDSTSTALAAVEDSVNCV